LTSIADSDAVLDQERMLAQHQAALTLLQGMVSNPTCDRVCWLDLASGRGQIIVHLAKNLSETERKKLSFQGYDIDNAHSRTAAKIASQMGLSGSDFHIGEIGQFWSHSATNGPWDFVTLTNTVHEIHPARLAEILARCIERLSETGTLFIYDMETLPEFELGAVLWNASEIKSILTCLCLALGADKFEPSVGMWKHRTCNGWNAQLKKQHMQLPDEYQASIPKAIESTASRISELLKLKLENTKAALESLTKFGAETEEEAKSKLGLLYQYWSITRALEVSK
jgi:hypothetical protein